MNVDHIWNEYRKKRTEIQKKILDLRTEDARNFKQSLDLINQNTYPHTVRSKPSGALDSEAQETSKYKKPHEMVSGYYQETRPSCDSDFMPNCS